MRRNKQKRYKTKFFLKKKSFLWCVQRWKITVFESNTLILSVFGIILMRQMTRHSECSAFGIFYEWFSDWWMKCDYFDSICKLIGYFFSVVPLLFHTNFKSKVLNSLILIGSHNMLALLLKGFILLSTWNEDIRTIKRVLRDHDSFHLNYFKF